MMTDDISRHLPRIPPLGDVTTHLGILRLAVERLIHRVDDHLRYFYPKAVETVELYLEAFKGLCDDDAERLELQLKSLAKVSAEAYNGCVNPECQEDERHQLMKDVVQLIVETPSEVFQECNSKGRLVGYSMN